MKQITVKQLFILLCADVKSLIKFDVQAVDSGFSRSHFSANKLKDIAKYYVKYSRDAGNYQINNIEELMEYVVIFGHELTHCLNNHSVYKTESKSENIAIETHADFQGARIATALYTYGTNLKKIIKEDYEYHDKYKKDKTAYCKLMARVFSKLYHDVYLNNDIPEYYPSAFKRVGLNIAGVASFFYRSPQFQKRKGEYVGMHLIMVKNLEEGIIKSIYDEKAENFESNEWIDNVVNIHRIIQGDDFQINDIESPAFEPVFGTSYYKDNFMRDFQKESMKNEILSYAKNKGLSDLINEDMFNTLY